ncbi:MULTISPECIES: SDR family oxidoreductase [unclassified Vibrio]|uniref:SDR family oxidoreductase n=1 Tax=unclassified Vibrio TaxID=2614977 RepID=UPI001267DC25|nr:MULTISPECIES: SDR family oxidoreductase [unclassified Vibrio]QFT39661.1 General stress protein 39 [Vibrio sp. THAF64]QGM37832.1 General stress protein 39 [Vibrio sp. THAF191d]QGN73175.1 General stress protein 39 [Vibrio sp. THAF191c]
MNSLNRDLEGKVALITGAARNMGRAFAVSLARRGADIVIHYNSDSSAGEAEETARVVKAQNARALLVQGDLSKEASVEKVYTQALAAFERIDIVINNAGLVVKKTIAEVTEEDFDRSFGINAKAPFFIMKHAAKHIQDNGRVINMGTSLLGAFTGFYGVYAGSKAPLEDFTRALAKEIGSRGITVNTVAPGPIDTAFFHGEENEQSVAYLSAASVMGRLGNIDDVVPMINFLTSEESRWVTGQTLFVNGGFVTR